MEILGAVLTGGRSTRMGQDKADLVVNDQTMLEWVVSALKQVTTETVVLGPDRPGYKCWPDSVHTEGPLAGIATALARSQADHVLVVAVDHPFVSAETLRHLVDRADGLPVVPVDEHGARQVTCALYPTAIGGMAQEEAAAGGSIQSLLDRVSFDAVSPDIWVGWGEDGRSWYSVDSPSALEEGLALYSPG